MDDATEHGSPTGTTRVRRRGRFGRRAWVRSVALVGGGLVAGGILAGTLTANAADGLHDDHRRPVGHPGGRDHDRRHHRAGGLPGGRRAARGDAGTTPGQSTTPESTTPESGT